MHAGQGTSLPLTKNWTTGDHQRRLRSHGHTRRAWDHTTCRADFQQVDTSHKYGLRNVTLMVLLWRGTHGIASNQNVGPGLEHEVAALCYIDQVLRPLVLLYLVRHPNHCNKTTQVPRLTRYILHKNNVKTLPWSTLITNFKPNSTRDSKTSFSLSLSLSKLSNSYQAVFVHHADRRGLFLSVVKTIFPRHPTDTNWPRTLIMSQHDYNCMMMICSES